MKKCGTCQQEKEEHNFYKRKGAYKDPYRSDCRSCHAYKAAQRKLKPPVDWIASEAARVAALRAQELINGRLCPKCQIIKPLAGFYPRRARKMGINTNCIECAREYNRQRRIANSKVFRSYGIKAHFKQTYGISPEDRKQMAEIQQNKCLGCNRHESEFKRALDIDHCHKTGKVRGLLCAACNLALGYVKDNPIILRSLAAYLESHQ